MTMSKRSTVVGVFGNWSDAERAVNELERMGFDRDTIGIARRDEKRADVAGAGDTKAGETAGGGAVAGAVTGGVIGALAAGLIPGIGPVIAAGALASIIGGALIGGATGAIAGALIGAGIPEDEAKWYQSEFEAGRTIVTVRADGRYDEVSSVLRRYGAYDIDNRPATTGAASTAASSVAGKTGSTGASGDRWEDVRNDYRNRWQQRYGTTGTSRWEDYEPSYRYTWERWGEDRYRSRAWSDVEPEFRSDWTTRNPNSPWETARDKVRDAWNSMFGDAGERSGSVRISETGTDMGSRTVVTPRREHHEHHYVNNRCVDCGDVYTS